MTNDSKMIFGFYHKSELIRYLSTCDDENLIFAAIDCSGEAEASLRRIQEIEENTNLPRLLSTLGFSSRLHGFAYIVEAITMCRQNPDASMTKEIYPKIADIHDTTVIRVERNIRSSIESAWNRGDQTLRNRIFGNSINPEKGKPTNRQFICSLADYVASYM